MATPRPGAARTGILGGRLLRAIRSGDVDAIRNMLEDLGLQTLFSLPVMVGHTVTSVAILNGNGDVVRLLLQEGADANEQIWSGDTLLHVATRYSQPAIVRLLLEYGAEPDTVNLHSEKALHVAMTENLPEIACILITHGNDPVRTVERAASLLDYARANNMREMVEALENLRESFDQHDPEFKLYVAIVTNNHGRVLELLEQHVNPFEVKLGMNKMSPLHAAARHPSVQLLAILLSKLDKIKLVNAQDKQGQTPLHYAAAKNNEENVDWLVFAGADPDIEDQRKKRAEHLAASVAVLCILRRPAYWISVPDAIIKLEGRWRRELLRTDCTLSNCQQNVPSDDEELPPVLMFRRITKDVEKEEMEVFERSALDAEDTCWELYEYRCSEKSAVCFSVNLTDRGFRPDKQTMLLKHKVGRLDCEELELVLRSDELFADCEIPLSTNGKLALVCRVRQTTATVPVGPAEADIQPQEFPGLKFEIPAETFHQKQNIIIQADDPPPLPHIDTPDDPKDHNPKDNEDLELSPIKNISCFYKIVNTGNERPHNAIKMSIPLRADSGHVMTFVLPDTTFHQKQNIIIQADDPPPLPHIDTPDDPKDHNPKDNEDLELSPIKNISCFYKIVNTGNERPHNAIKMSIPLRADSGHVMTFVLPDTAHPEEDTEDGDSPRGEVLRDIEELELLGERMADDEHAAHPGQAAAPQYDNDDGEDEYPPDFEDTDSDDSDDDGHRDIRPRCDMRPDVDHHFDDAHRLVGDPQFDDTRHDAGDHHSGDAHRDAIGQPRWTALPRTAVDGQENVVRTDIQNFGVVVAAEVRTGVTSEEVIRALRDLYARQRRKEILIFPVAKPAPGQRVEVMLCCVSEERYDSVLSRLQGQGHRLLTEPIVAYAFNRETFLLKLRGNLADIYADNDPPVLEYEVGGRLNYTTFVLEAKDSRESPSGVISIMRTTSENSQYPSVGRVHVDLSPFLSSRQEAPQVLTDIDNLLMKLATKMKTDFARVYCHALGLTKKSLRSVTKLQHIPPSEKIFRMLSLTRSMYRSEEAFLTHLLDVLEKHTEKLLVSIVKNFLEQM